jgi:hypothetical protein
MNGINNRLKLTIDNIEADGQDANLDAVINLKPFGGEPPLVLTFTLKEDGEAFSEVVVYLDREQALILGQFLMLAAHVKEPD